MKTAKIMTTLIIQILEIFLTPTAIRFRKALTKPMKTQKLVQKEIFKLLIASEYGKSLNITSRSDWQHIPIVEYNDIQEWIHKQQQSNTSLLTPEPTIFYEKTSGSSSAAKLIPYTISLRRSFSQMFAVWVEDLLQHGPSFSTGKIYFCISPQLGKSAPEENLGMEDDLDYLDGYLKWFLSPFLVSVSGLNKIRNPEEFKQQLCLTLLQQEKLEIISIWSPTFLKVHLDYIQKNQLELAEKLKNKLAYNRHQELLKPEISWTKIWPHLKLISCWDRAQAKEQAQFLRSLFPGVIIQGKGLLATEAPMTIPLLEAQGFVPVLNEVFFEFEDYQGNIYLLHELKIGAIYSLIISQKGGLYRYRIGDRVKVSHYYLNTPCLEFLGRNERTSDLVGEKLNEDFVREVIDNLNLTGTFFKSLVPVTKPQPHYVLLLEKTESDPIDIAQKLESNLSQSPHYHLARLLGQLSSAKVLISQQIPEIITLHKLKSGSKWGDIKHQILVTTPIEDLDLRSHI